MRTDSIEDRAGVAAVELAGRLGWRHVRLADVAEEAGTDLGALRALARDKTDLLRHFLAGIDRDVLSEDSGFTAEDGVRDRLFDLLMRRFDALDPYKDGVRSVLADVPRDPFAMARLAPDGPASLAWYLEAAGVGADGPGGMLRAHGLAAVWLAALRVWVRDESSDLAPTMKALDQALARAEQAAGWLSGRRGDPKARQTQAEPPDAEGVPADG